MYAQALVNLFQSSLTLPEGTCTGEAGTASWDDLPEEVKEIILGHLLPRELAKTAATCVNFAARVKLGAVNAKFLSIPLGACFLQ